MTTVILYGVGAIVLASLLIIAYIMGREIADRTNSEAAPTSQPAADQAASEQRCECRRYASPSPLCPVHWDQAA